MMNLERALPLGIEVFADEPSMTMMRLILGAKQAPPLKHLRLEPIFDLSLFHKSHERIFVDIPIALVAFERFQDVVRRREKRLMNILRAANLFHEIGQIVGFRETSELRCVM